MTNAERSAQLYKDMTEHYNRYLELEAAYRSADSQADKNDLIDRMTRVRSQWLNALDTFRNHLSHLRANSFVK